MSSLDRKLYGKCDRSLESVPANVRCSTGILEGIPSHFDAEEHRLESIEKSFSLPAVKAYENTPPKIQQSIELFDSILDEIKPGSLAQVFRHPTNSGTFDKKYRHEDVRRSLDVLDSVLAEFDDCLESWDDINKKAEYTDYNSNSVKLNDAVANENQLCFHKYSTDGTTSHFPPSIVSEQPRIISPPPIPKRSPATKLSERHADVFTFPPEHDSSLDSLDLSSTNPVFPQQRIRGSPLSSDCCDILHDTCANCGRAVKTAMIEQPFNNMKADDETRIDTFEGLEMNSKASGLEVDNKSDDEAASSPFHKRKNMFEQKIAEASAANVSRSPSLNRSYGTSFKTKRLVENWSNKSLEESGFENGNVSELSIESSKNGSVVHHSVNCICKDRIRELNAKFSDVRRLMKLNKIRGLDAKPPNFVPSLPPIAANGDSPHPTKLQVTCSSNKDDMKSFQSDEPSNDSLLQGTEHESLRSASSNNSLSTSLSDSRLTDSSSMYNKCLSSLSVHLSETIEDLPKLLPTDALNRPHLGFSYSMEEDLSPGVKEIIQTSTPKNGISSPRLFRTKESNLSTFSHSASSLGYVSSQSDLELNDLSTIPDKVPLSSFKSRTLPNGLDRSPFYSAEDDSFNNSYYSKFQRPPVTRAREGQVEALSRLQQEKQKRQEKDIRHTLNFVNGYIILIKTFAEFFGAACCICYGLLEVDPYFITLGLVSIITGLGFKALLLYQRNRPKNPLVNVTIYITIGFYVLVVLCS
ncbi:hypothetical protein JTE90_005854 [Oedothorax gibbosus]|uniref:Uncharacterized protein n=1 Tax=Oedothorax gibbosus TaxID=931172 RepID=A0AAV6UPW5_9ARAC|nr:hypothetical protein JTE90_005854 [Oedothorax gibbosus]